MRTPATEQCKPQCENAAYRHIRRGFGDENRRFKHIHAYNHPTLQVAVIGNCPALVHMGRTQHPRLPTVVPRNIYEVVALRVRIVGIAKPKSRYLARKVVGFVSRQSHAMVSPIIYG